MAEFIEPMRAIISMEHDVRVIQDETIVRAVHDIAGITVDRDRLVLALTKASAFYEEGYRAGKKAAEVVKVVPELREAVIRLHEEYEKAKQLQFVRDPLAYALYQTWKDADGTRKNGR